MRILITLGLLLCLLACNNASENNQEVSSQTPINAILTKEDVQGLNYMDFALDSKADKLIVSWAKYYELNDILNNVKQADLTYFKDNHEILEALVKDLKSSIPERFNTPMVNARLLALETKLYKIEDVINLSNVKKEDALFAVKELLISFSNLNLQMNKQIERESQNIQKP